MGRASSSKKVARAASTGGGRTARGSRPLVWYAAITVVVALGVAGIVFSRAERRSELAAGNSLAPPVVGRDHWHAAYGVYLCGEFAPSITDQRDPKGIHTHGDGVIHIHPTVRSAAGEKSTLGLYADAVRMTLTDDEIRLPGGKSFKEGDTKCDGKDAIVQVKVDNDKVVTENVRDIKYTDRQLLTIAFAPKGAELPEPPTKGQLDNLTDVPQQQTPVPLPTDPNAPVEPEAPAAEGDTSTTTPADGADGGSPTSTP